MRPSRQVRPLSRMEVEDLDQTYRVTNSANVRTRCQIILLSNEGYAPSAIAQGSVSVKTPSCVGLIGMRPRDWRRWGDNLDRGGLPRADDFYDQVLDARVDHEPDRKSVV